MKFLFGFHEILEVITNGVLKLVENATDVQRVANKKAKKKDCKVAYCIQSVVDSVNFDKISHVESTKETWDVLVKYYERGEKVKVVKLHTLRRQYKLLQMEENKKIAGYVLKVDNLIHLMKGYGETLTNEMIVEKVMCMLTSHFDHFIIAIQKSNNLETLKLENLVDSLEMHEIRIVERKGVRDLIQTLQAQA